MRVRFAPSPTGYLHVGGARTALFNWLFARHHRGAFVLRVEDTDAKRYQRSFENAIYAAMRWLGLAWDEGPDVGGPFGPYRQSERLQTYAHVANDLLAKDAAYECFCEPETVDVKSTASRCPCGELTEAQRAARREGVPQPALRLRVDPARPIAVDDLIRGTVTYPAGSLDDFVIVKSGGGPLYNFAAVVDDHAMVITHVIRGDEHLANTPKQLLMYEAMAWQPPKFAHIPIILNERRAKLSKRDGAVFLNDYEAMGILPDAMFNFLALLGWSPGNNRELLTREELIGEFDLDRVVKHPAIFDLAKLRWMNAEYMKRARVEDVAESVRRLIKGSVSGDAVASDASRLRLDKVEPATALLKDRVQTVADIVEQGAYFFYDGPVEPASEALAKYCATPDTIELLRQIRAALENIADFTRDRIEASIRALADARGKKAAAYIHPLRVALTGQAVSPPIFDVTVIVGKTLALRRIDDLVRRLESGRAASSVEAKA